jgi:hypothetical protein
MRLYAPLYEGDSLLRPDVALGEPAVTVFKTPSRAIDIVHSNIEVDAANETPLDLYSIEQAARAMRAAEVGRMMKAAYVAVVDWLDRNETSERDYFFATSANLSDLENRQRHFERTGLAHY